MISTKKRKKNKCIKCKSKLSPKNWATYDKNKKYYICKLCRKNIDKKCHANDLNYSKKQKIRYRMRRSAVILAYGNACHICGEDEYNKLTINGNVNYLYDNIVCKSGYKITCYNCKKAPYKNKYVLKYKKRLVKIYGGYCKECKEDRPERLTVKNKKITCYNCYMSDTLTKRQNNEYPNG